MRNGTLSDRLRWARETSGLSARALCKSAAISHSMVMLIEQGRTKNIQADTLKALARVLGVSMDWLYTGSGQTPSRSSLETAGARAMAALKGKAGRFATAASS